MERLVKMLKLHEGVRNHVYVCTAGYETIGVGRNISESGLGLTDEEINILLMNFNLGLSRLRGFVKAITAMSRQQWDVAADEFMDSRWSEQVGQRAITVTNMIRTGDYPE